MKVPCAAQPRAHGGGTSLCSKLRARGNAVLEQPVGGTSVPFPCASATLLTTKKSRITTVLSLNAALSESETSIRAIYLLANLRGKKKKNKDSFPRVAVAQVRWAVELVLAAHVLS